MVEFLLEIGTEEIPARMLGRAGNDLKQALEKALTKSALPFSPLEAHGAPRQLVVFGRDLAVRQEDREETVLGPPVRIAYDGEGKPTKALAGFLKKNPQLTPDRLFRVEQKRGEVVAGKVHIRGRLTRDILAEAIPAILSRLHFPKAMRWGAGATRFVRPVRSILALLDGGIIPFSFAGMEAADLSFGHRTEGVSPHPIQNIAGYLAYKSDNGIMVRHEDRKQAIRTQMDRRLAAVGGRWVPDEDLLEEVADLVEQPYVVLGNFEARFLDIPREVLVTSLRDHQKSFCIQDENGALLPHFLSLASVVEDRKGLIRKGNEWVLNARLWDAKFFWEADLKKDLEQLRQKLKQLVFQTKIGSYFEKTERLIVFCAWMATELGWSDAEKEALCFGARHCKTDLVSELVFEFPELQGQTGGLLLKYAGRSETVWRSVYDHYRPYSMEDQLPTHSSGALIALADKLDTLVGCFAAGLIPTGTRDPYALRRAAQGIVRLLIEHELPFSLPELLKRAIAGYSDKWPVDETLRDRLSGFFPDRLRYYLKRKGYGHDLIEAVLVTDMDRVDQILKRADAVARQRSKESFRTLSLNLKRMKNVIADELDRLPEFDESLLTEKPELDLWDRFKTLRNQIKEAAQTRSYNRAMDLMNELADPVEHYFGTAGVYVNVDDERIRRNRKSMILQIRLTLGLVADISCLERK